MVGEVGDEPTREEVDLLHRYGFHEVSGLVGVWQRRRTGVDVPVDPKVYTTKEALESIELERGEQENR